MSIELAARTLLQIGPPLRRTTIALLMFAVFQPVSPALGDVAYDVEFVGLEETPFTDDVKAASQLVELKDRPPATTAGLRRRADTDVERIRELLRAKGFYGAEVDFSIAETEAKARVVVRVDPGPSYRIRSIDVRANIPEGAPDPVPAAREALELAPGAVAEAAAVVAAEKRLVAAFGRHGYPLAQAGERTATVDHSRRTMSLVFVVIPGSFTRFGSTRVTGLRDVEEAYVRRRIVWQEDGTFISDKLETTRGALRASGLFSVVNILYPAATDSEGKLPIEIAVTERSPRSIGAGATFSTSDGFGGKVFWQHRNLWGEGEQLGVTLEAGTVRTGAFADFRKPDIWGNTRDLVLDARLNRQEPDGFESKEAGIGGRIEQFISPIYSAFWGVGFEHLDIDDRDGSHTFKLVSFPLGIRRDASDNLLNPTEGDRTILTLTPYLGVFGSDVNFLVPSITESGYLPLSSDRDWVLAGWVRLASIFGNSTRELPASKRLYAGGPGSVRAYGLNKVGPVDDANDPIGGRSLTAFGGEVRYRLTENIGIVPFIEAGAVYDSTVPEIGEDLQWGAGIGLRYFTPIGPIRLDLAFPLNRRRDVDDAFQILVSIGQAF